MRDVTVRSFTQFVIISSKWCVFVSLRLVGKLRVPLRFPVRPDCAGLAQQAPSLITMTLSRAAHISPAVDSTAGSRPHRPHTLTQCVEDAFPGKEQKIFILLLLFCPFDSIIVSLWKCRCVLESVEWIYLWTAIFFRFHPAAKRKSSTLHACVRSKWYNNV